LRRTSKDQHKKQERDIDLYYYQPKQEGEGTWEHVNPNWPGSHAGPLAKFGFPYFGKPDTSYRLKSTYYKLEL
ncbi:MAG: hypothetical protein RMI91_12800, partial [Gemmatales bacterium]|nr:hypothetical protein [Gemmatales bacterium]MDW7995521.1 hypothetical protein [Gemmatales bacterium]